MIGLSKTTLSLFKECPRCFWLAKMQKIERPRGIMASIMNGIDGAMKLSVEGALLSRIQHPFLDGMVLEPHYDRAMVAKCRKWQSFQAVVDVGNGQEVKCWGEMDEILVDQGGIVTPWEYKSKGKATDESYIEKWYQTDGDLYHLLLEEGPYKLKCSGKAVFTFAYPVAMPDHRIGFEYMTLQTTTDPERAKVLLKAAADCLEGPLPAAAKDCEMCSYLKSRVIFTTGMQELEKQEASKK